MTIDPTTGGVGAEFEGHVAANGVDLLLGAAGQSPLDRRINWRPTKGGAVLADVRAYDLPSDRVMRHHVDGADGRRATNYLEAQGSSAGTYAEVDVAAGGADPSAVRLAAQTGAQVASRKLLDSAGTSDFTQNSEFNSKFSTQAAVLLGFSNFKLGIFNEVFWGACQAASAGTIAYAINWSCYASGYYGVTVQLSGTAQGGGYATWMFVINGVATQAFYSYHPTNDRRTVPRFALDIGYRNEGTTYNLDIRPWANSATDGGDYASIHVFRRA